MQVRALSAPDRQRSSGAAAALRPQSAPRPNRMGPPELTTQDHHQPNDHGAWSLPPGSSPMVGHHADNLPKCTCGGTGEHPLVLVLPSQPTSTLALDQLHCRRGGAAACAHAMRRPRSAIDPRATDGQRSTIPSLQALCGQATTPPADHGDTSNPLPQRGRPAHRAIPRASAVRTARLQSRGHRRPVRPDTPAWHRTRGHRTRGHRTSA